VASRKRKACSHHWRIETPTGPVCNAICLQCGAEREFRTAAENQWVTRSEAETDAA
jgi:hypothetical protein